MANWLKYCLLTNKPNLSYDINNKIENEICENKVNKQVGTFFGSAEA